MSNSIYTLQFSGWINPPIYYDMDQIIGQTGTVDPYYVQFMKCYCGYNQEPYYEIPLVTATQVEPAPPAAVAPATLPPPSPCEFLCNGVQTSNSNSDPASFYYLTMTVTQPGANGKTFRHRVFKAPTPSSMAGIPSVGGNDIVAYTTPFRVQSIPGVATMDYQLYVIINPIADKDGPRYLYLQQPR